MKNYSLLFLITLLSNLYAMDGGSPAEGEDLGGAGGGSFRGLEVVKRIPAATNFYQSKIQMAEAKNIQEARIKCSELNGKIIGSQALPGLNQNCFTFYCAKDLSTGLDGKYLATYGYCQKPPAVSHVSDIEEAKNRCRSLEGDIYTKTITEHNGEQCSTYNCASDFVASEIGVFIAQYKECHLIVSNNKNTIKNISVTPDKKIIYVDGVKYVVHEQTPIKAKETSDRATASDQ